MHLFLDCFLFVCYFVQNAFLRQMNTFVPTLFPVPYERKLRTYTYYSAINCTEVRRRQILLANHYQDDSLCSIPIY